MLWLFGKSTILTPYSKNLTQSITNSTRRLSLIGIYAIWQLSLGCLLMRTIAKIVSEYDQEIPQSQPVENPVEPRGRAAQPSQDTRKTIKAKQPALSLPHQDDCNTRTDTKQRKTKHRKFTDSHNGSNNNQTSYVILVT